MSRIILHHYPMSPFAEKVRLILGYKQLSWQSVIIPTVMPKPDLTALTGGYRRTPVLQIGADIYCDTPLIAEVLEALAPERSLYPPAREAVARTLAQWADTTLFWTMIPYCFQPAGMAEMFANVPPEYVKAFGKDRAAMRAGHTPISLSEASASLPVYLARLEQMLDGQSFLLGDVPTIADFSVYHPVWFIRRLPGLVSIFQDTPRLLVWAERMKAFGHGHHQELGSDAALQVARDSTPATMPGASQADECIGQVMTITPSDYALDPVEGKLVWLAPNHMTLQRHDERAGTVAVHFPRIGFRLDPVQPLTTNA